MSQLFIFFIFLFTKCNSYVLEDLLSTGPTVSSLNMAWCWKKVEPKSHPPHHQHYHHPQYHHHHYHHRHYHQHQHYYHLIAYYMFKLQKVNKHQHNISNKSVPHLGRWPEKLIIYERNVQ